MIKKYTDNSTSGTTKIENYLARFQVWQVCHNRKYLADVSAISSTSRRLQIHSDIVTSLCQDPSNQPNARNHIRFILLTFFGDEVFMFHSRKYDRLQKNTKFVDYKKKFTWTIFWKPWKQRKAQNVKTGLKKTLSIANCKLCKINTNYRNINSNVVNKEIRTDNIQKRLGLKWNRSKDIWILDIIFKERVPDTKQKILSEIMGIFDPLELKMPI
jgi:hypothetical protein